jgi:hypothetical protein
MIEVNVTGLEQLEALTARLQFFGIVEEQVYEIFREVMYEFYQDVVRDPAIPDKYKESVVFFYYPPTVIITYAPKVVRAGEERKLTTRAEWVLYWCVKRKYLGGEIAEVPEYLDVTWLEEKWEKEKDKYINKVRDRVVELVKRVLIA